jgi:hypothetical protein
MWRSELEKCATWQPVYKRKQKVETVRRFLGLGLEFTPYDFSHNMWRNKHKGFHITISFSDQSLSHDAALNSELTSQECLSNFTMHMNHTGNLKNAVLSFGVSHSVLSRDGCQVVSNPGMNLWVTCLVSMSWEQQCEMVISSLETLSYKIYIWD